MTTQNSNCEKTKIVRKLNTQVVTKIKNSNCKKKEKSGKAQKQKL